MFTWVWNEFHSGLYSRLDFLAGAYLAVLPLSAVQVEDDSVLLASQTVESLSDPEVLALFYDWKFWARENQNVPTGDWWTIWLILAGRGYGKTRVGAEFIRAAQAGEINGHRYGRMALIGEDAGDARDVMIEGEAGILAISPPWNRPTYEPTKRRLTWDNGAIATVFSDADPEALRGPSHDLLWADELAKYKHIGSTWSNAMFGLRLGKHPLACVTSTPKPIPLIRDLVKREGRDVMLTRGTTYENEANLAPTFFTEIITIYEGTNLGRQEIHAELIDPEEAGIIKRSWLNMWRTLYEKKPGKWDTKKLPKFRYIVQSYDTAFTEEVTTRKEKKGHDPDYTACTVWGIFDVPDNTLGEGVSGFTAMMLLDAWKERMGYPNLRKKVFNDYKLLYGENAQPVDCVLVEKKGSGISLLQDLNLAKVPATGYNPGRADKTQRLHITSPYVKGGRVFIPESTNPQNRGKFVSWSDDLIMQICGFPLLDHDDFVDSFSQAVIMLRDLGFIRLEAAPPNEKDYHNDNKGPNHDDNPYTQ